MSRRLALFARGLCLVASLVCALLTVEFASPAFFSWSDAEAQLSPQTAEQVSQRAAKFQRDTPDTNGLFQIIQDQHSQLALLSSFAAGTSSTLRHLAVVGFIAFSLLTVAFVVLGELIRRTHLTRSGVSRLPHPHDA